jgi:fibronectin-binding autotransporter adhesin
MNTPQRNSGLLVTFAALLVFGAEAIQGASAIWGIKPESGDWNNGNNWSPGGPPNGSSDIATFGLSAVTNVFLSANTEVNGITFTAGASPYTITTGSMHALTISGAGITNLSGITQNFVADPSGFSGRIEFTNNATAGSATSFTMNSGGLVQFHDSSTAGAGAFTINAGGNMRFDGNSSTAGNGTFTLNGPGGIFDQEILFQGGTAGHGTFTINGGSAFFANSSTAGNAIITANGSNDAGNFEHGSIIFFNVATTGSATLIANGGTNGGMGGTIAIIDGSAGGNARVELFGNGTLIVGESLSDRNITIGSLEGDGNVLLSSVSGGAGGTNGLNVGSNNLSTTFSGVISGPRALIKIGSGTLALSGTNTYTGVTTVNAGKLIVDGAITSTVTVNGGTLGGSGTTGAITVNKGGVLSPGNSPGILNANGNLKLSLGSTYLVDLNGTTVGKEYDQTNVTGVVSLDTATLSLNLGFTPTAGSTFTIINNDLNDIVIGTFGDLSEGATFVSGGRTFTISYQGGDGNDVALTAVVPEPTTWTLLILGIVIVFVARKRSVDRSYSIATA